MAPPGTESLGQIRKELALLQHNRSTLLLGVLRPIAFIRCQLRQGGRGGQDRERRLLPDWRESWSNCYEFPGRSPTGHGGDQRQEESCEYEVQEG